MITQCDFNITQLINTQHISGCVTLFPLLIWCASANSSFLKNTYKTPQKPKASITDHC